jgi:hypothetical protein
MIRLLFPDIFPSLFYAIPAAVRDPKSQSELIDSLKDIRQLLGTPDAKK